jgi:hypothetical protein
LVINLPLNPSRGNDRFVPLLALYGCSWGRRTNLNGKGELGPRDRIKFEAALAEFRAQMFAEAGTRQEYQRLVRRGMNGLTAPLIVLKFNSNVDKAGRNAADALFDVKRAVTGRKAEADRPARVTRSEQSEERFSEEQRGQHEQADKEQREQ